MTCAECQERLIAYKDGWLPDSEQQQMSAHLEGCSTCRSQWQALVHLEDRIDRNAQHWGQTDLENKVLGRILAPPEEPLQPTSRNNRFWQLGRQIMKSPKTRVAAAAVVALAITLTSLMNTPTSAQQVLQGAMDAIGELHAIHMKARMRTLPRDNFAVIGLQFDFVPIEMWKRTHNDELEQWRIEKPGRVVVVDGVSTTMLIRPNHAFKKDIAAPLGSFNTWFGPLLNVEKLLDNEIKAARKRPESWMHISHETMNERDKTILHIERKATVSEDDYLRNRFISLADRSIVYQFDTQTKLLESLHIFVHHEDKEVLVFEITEINYHPDIEDTVFTLDLPDNVNEFIGARILPDNERYAAMGPKEMATAFFQACAEENWDEALKFMTTSRVDERFKSAYGGLTIVSIGEPFQSEAMSDLQWIVPYEIKFCPAEQLTLVSNNNAAGRHVIMGWYNSDLQPSQTLEWNTEPALLAPDSPYQTLSPEEVVSTCETALLNLDFDTLCLFMPKDEVEPMKNQLQAALKSNPDVKKILPRTEIKRSFWSKEHQGTFVVTSESRTKAWNLGVRKDNDAHRFVIDGGL